MFGRKFRIRQYVRRRSETKYVVANSGLIVNQLATTWRLFKIKDLNCLDDKKTANMVVTVWCGNLPTLIERLHTFNTLISEDKDSRIEALSYQWFVEKDEVSFDMFFTDNKHYPVDVESSLTRLQGLIQHHEHVTKQHSNAYYKRMTEPLYQDIVELTDALVGYMEDHLM